MPTTYYISNEPARPLRATKVGLNEGRIAWSPLVCQTGTLLENVFPTEERVEERVYVPHTFSPVVGRNSGNFGFRSDSETTANPCGIVLSTSRLNKSFQEVTVAAWATMECTQGHNVLFEQGGDFNGIGIGWRRTPQTIVAFALDNGVASEVASAEPFTANSERFIHVTFTFNRGVLTLYIDGVFQSTDTHPSDTIGAANDDASIFGRAGGKGNFDTPKQWRGVLSEFSYWNRALSQEEVTALHLEGLHQNPTTLERNRYPINIGAAPPATIVPILDHHARMMGY